ncbi:hypothetical protein [Paenibacillus montanisoli]|uniref:Uncharacterized protein n=1 Tax=Paenibacillus montanisoli TaxID=2081970 RepID=A0A328TSN8_9BACL|nr:hypothetical protein [Paenibacillus montanisoli]RAP73599.1 hypothetical protein DL346_25325 [Paenibacillus montanisoli]
MNYLYFSIGSSIEYFSVFVLMFTLFRFPVTERLNITLIVSLMMSQVSYFSRLMPEIGDFSSYIQLGLLVIVLWILFRVPLYYSLIMNAAAFIVGFAIQGLTLLILSLSGTPLEFVTGTPIISAAVQLLTAAIVFAISRTIYIKHWGYDYVPASHRANVSITGTNAILLVVVVTSLVVAAGAGLVLRGNFKDYAIVASVIFLLTIPLFLHYSIRKDKEDAG